MILEYSSFRTLFEKSANFLATNHPLISILSVKLEITSNEKPFDVISNLIDAALELTARKSSVLNTQIMKNTMFQYNAIGCVIPTVYSVVLLLMKIHRVKF